MALRGGADGVATRIDYDEEPMRSGRADGRSTPVILRRLLRPSAALFTLIAGVAALSVVHGTESLVTVGGGAAPEAITVIPLQVKDLIFDATRNKLIASVPASNATIGNSVVSIDPVTGEVGPATFVGSDPNKLALSDDGSTLYVGLDGAGAVAQVDWAARTVTRTIYLAPYSGYRTQASDIEVAPGQPGRVVVSPVAPGLSPGFAGLVVFENGVALPKVTGGHTGSAAIEFGTGTRLYGYNYFSTGFQFYRNTVDGTGVIQNDALQGLVSGFSTDIEYAGGRIYTTTGTIVDPEAGRVVGSLGIGSPALTVNPGLNRVYMPVTDNLGTRLGVFDTTTFRAVAYYDASQLSSTRRLVVVGPNRLAGISNAGVVLVDLQTLSQPPPTTTTASTTTTTASTTTTTAPPPGGSSALVPLPPARLLETRFGPGYNTVDGSYQNGGTLAADSQIELEVTGRGGVPVDATAVMINVTAVNPSSAGYVTVYPCGTARPLASNLNYVAGDVVANLVLAKVGDFSSVCLYTTTRTELIVDVSGYISGS